jgi:hypothetical protein
MKQGVFQATGKLDSTCTQLVQAHLGGRGGGGGGGTRGGRGRGGRHGGPRGGHRGGHGRSRGLHGGDGGGSGRRGGRGGGGLGRGLRLLLHHDDEARLRVSGTSCVCESKGLRNRWLELDRFQGLKTCARFHAMGHNWTQLVSPPTSVTPATVSVVSSVSTLPNK